MNEHAPRSAAVLLSNALGHLDLIEPAAAREPVRGMLRAAIEECTVSSSLLGKRLNYVLRSIQSWVSCTQSSHPQSSQVHDPSMNSATHSSLMILLLLLGFRRFVEEAGPAGVDASLRPDVAAPGGDRSGT